VRLWCWIRSGRKGILALVTVRLLPIYNISYLYHKSALGSCVSFHVPDHKTDVTSYWLYRAPEPGKSGNHVGSERPKPSMPRCLCVLTSCIAFGRKCLIIFTGREHHSPVTDHLTNGYSFFTPSIP
jgi:hypothetical protein